MKGGETLLRRRGEGWGFVFGVYAVPFSRWRSIVSTSSCIDRWSPSPQGMWVSR